jgi:hypothetical protein
MNNKVRFLPFHAINEFMLDDFRLEIIQSVFGNFKNLSEERQRKINSIVKKYVKVQGFRNASLAPLPMKINGCIDTFKKSHDFVAQILNAWTELNDLKKSIVFEFLEERSWILLPIEADRSLLPGFMVEWPENDGFEVLTQAFREKNPEFSISDDEISLMVVWVSNRLPYEMVENLFSKDSDSDQS